MIADTKQRAAMLLSAALLAVTLGAGCNRGVGPAPAPGTSGDSDLEGVGSAATNPITLKMAQLKRGPQTTGAATQPTEVNKQDLIRQAGFDMMNPNYSKETGRDDPFMPIGEEGIPGQVLTKSAPDRFRVCGVARTPTGIVAILESGTDYTLVKLGQKLKNGYTVKSIDMKKVVLGKDKGEVFVSLRPAEPQTMTAAGTQTSSPGLGKLPTLGDMYQKYLENKFQAPGGGNAPSGTIDFGQYLKAIEGVGQSQQQPSNKEGYEEIKVY